MSRAGFRCSVALQDIRNSYEGTRSVLPAVRDRQALVSTLRGLLGDPGRQAAREGASRELEEIRAQLDHTHDPGGLTRLWQRATRAVRSIEEYDPEASSGCSGQWIGLPYGSKRGS